MFNLPIDAFGPSFCPNEESLVFDDDGIARHVVEIDVFVKNLKSNVKIIILLKVSISSEINVKIILLKVHISFESNVKIILLKFQFLWN